MFSSFFSKSQSVTPPSSIESEDYSSSISIDSTQSISLDEYSSTSNKSCLQSISFNYNLRLICINTQLTLMLSRLSIIDEDIMLQYVTNTDNNISLQEYIYQDEGELEIISTYNYSAILRREGKLMLLSNHCSYISLLKIIDGRWRDVNIYDFAELQSLTLVARRCYGDIIMNKITCTFGIINIYSYCHNIAGQTTKIIFIRDDDCYIMIVTINEGQSTIYNVRENGSTMNRCNLM